MAAPIARKSLVGLFKQGWHEIPEVVGSCIMGLVGTGICGIAAYMYYQNDGDNRRFKSQIVILRPDDPRVAKIRKD